MYKTIVKIEGMMCGMCEAHIQEALRKAYPSAKKVKASRSKREASFLSEYMPDPEKLRLVIADTGYICLGTETVPYKKKGLFG